jgi:hypothetical protein
MYIFVYDLEFAKKINYEIAFGHRRDQKLSLFNPHVSYVKVIDKVYDNLPM